jgi:uncharacterized membrane protein required for colicin V production
MFSGWLGGVFMSASMALDVLTVAIILYAVLTSSRRGFAKTAVELTGYVASIAVAYVFSAPVGNWLYASFVKPTLYSQVNGYISSAVSKSAATAAQQTAAVTNSQLSDFLSAIPANFDAFLSAFGLRSGSLETLSNSAAKTGGNQATSLIMSGIVEPVGTALSRGIAFAALFAVCILVVRLLANVISAVFKLPGLNILNRLGGAALGIVKGLLLMLLITTVAALLIPMLSLQQNPWLSAKVIDQTAVFRIIYHMNPLTGILLNSR